MSECERCGKFEMPPGDLIRLPFGFCKECYECFTSLREQLRLAYIHHYMHPEKKTIWVHDADSKRHVKRDVKGESKLISSVFRR